MILNKTNSRVIIFLFTLFITSLFFNSCIALISFDSNSAESLTFLPKELHEKPSIAVSGENVHVTWATWPDEYNCAIYYKRSLDNGKNWTEAININLNDSKAMDPQIAVNNNYVNIIWIDYRNNKSEIYHSFSDDNGETWNEPNRLTFNSTRKSCIFDIGLYSNGDNLYSVWKDYRYGSSEILFKKSNDNGLTWDDDQRLTADYTPSYAPFLSCYEKNLFIVYEDWSSGSEIAFLKSKDAGITWSQKVQLTDIQKNGDSENPNLFVNDNTLYLVWQNGESNSYNIYFTKSNDDGEKWENVTQLTYSPGSLFNPQIYVYQRNVMVIWQEEKNGSFGIYYKLSNDDGETWGDIQTLQSNKNCYDLCFSFEGENIHFVWQVYHEPTWGDIWYLGNSDYIKFDDPIEKTKEDDKLPGFELVITIISIFTLLSILKIRKNKRGY